MHKTKESKCIGTSQDTGRALPREIPGAKADRYKMQNWNFYSQIQKYKYKHQGPRTNHTKFKTRIYIHKCENTNVYKMARKWNNKHKTVDVEKTQIDRKIGKIGGINIQTGNAKAKRIWTCLDRSGGLTRQGFITGKAGVCIDLSLTPSQTGKGCFVQLFGVIQGFGQRTIRQRYLKEQILFNCSSVTWTRRAWGNYFPGSRVALCHRRAGHAFAKGGVRDAKSNKNSRDKFLTPKK